MIGDKRRGPDAAIGWMVTADVFFLLMALLLVRLNSVTEGRRSLEAESALRSREMQRELELREKTLELARWALDELESLPSRAIELEAEVVALKASLESCASIHKEHSAQSSRISELSATLREVEDLLRLARKKVDGLMAESEDRVARIRELERRIDVFATENNRLQEELARANDPDRCKKPASTCDAVARDNRSLRENLEVLSGKLRDAEQSAKGANVEIARLRAGQSGAFFAGLAKEDARVLFVVDHSKSMDEPLSRDDARGDRRWSAVTGAITNWLDNIGIIERAGLLTFSSSVAAFPDDYTLIDLTAEGGRDRIKEQLGKVRPEGGTNMVRAFETVFDRYASGPSRVDAVVLFTDGRPTVESSRDEGATSTELCKRILRLVRSKVEADGRVPRVHVVAMGDYFDRDFGGFLVDLATTTGGSFRGWN